MISERSAGKHMFFIILFVYINCRSSKLGPVTEEPPDCAGVHFYITGITLPAFLNTADTGTATVRLCAWTSHEWAPAGLQHSQ